MIKCPHCDKFISKFGLAKHARSQHGENVIIRNKENSAPIYDLRKRFTSEEIIRNVLNFKSQFINALKLYEEGHSLKDISEKFSVSYGTVKAFFKEKNIKIENRSGLILQEKFQQDIINFANSEDGKKLISEYKAYGGTLKGLRKKYGLFPRTMKQVLIYVGVPLKNNIQARREQAKLSMGKNHFRYGKPVSVGAGKCHWYLYEGVKYQGSWEFKFGLWLKSKGVKFLCHVGVKTFPYILNGLEKTYCPDFYIESWGKYVDVKGFFSKPDQDKMKAVIEQNPAYTFEIYDKEKLIQNEILSIDKKLGINIEKFMIDYKTQETYFDQLMNNVNNVNKESLIDDWILNKKSWVVKAKELQVPFIVFSKYMHSIAPKYGSDDYYWFLINRYLNLEDIKSKLRQGISRKSLARSLKPFTFKANYLLINKIYNLLVDEKALNVSASI